MIVSGGDLVMGPLPAECLDLLEADGRVRFLSGNGDREACELEQDGDLGEAAGWCSERLGPERLARVERWPSTVDLEVPDLGGVLFCHGTPTSDASILTAATPEEDVARELGDVARRCRRLRPHSRPVRPPRGSDQGRQRRQRRDAVRGIARTRAGRSSVRTGSSSSRRRTMPSPRSTLSRGRASRSSEQWLAPVLLGHVTADEATDEFERRRRGA